MKTLLLILFPLWLFAQPDILMDGTDRLLDGTNYLVTPNNNYYFDSDGTEYFTSGLESLGTAHSVSFWINMTDANSSYSYNIAIGGSISNVQNVVYVYWNGGATAYISYTAANLTVNSATFTKDSNWHHIVVARNGTEVKFYLDNVLHDTKTLLTGGSLAFQYYLRAQYLNTSWWDDISIWSNQLSAGSVTTLYGGGLPTTSGNWELLDGIGSDICIHYIDFETGPVNMIDIPGNLVINTPATATREDFVRYTLNKYVDLGGTNESLYWSSDINLGTIHTICAWVARPVSTSVFIGSSTTSSFVTLSSTGFSYRATGVNNSFTTTLATNAWNHVAIARSGTQVKAYINGVLLSTNTMATNPNFTFQYLGRQTLTYYATKIDNLAIYSTQLSDSDIANIYHSGLPSEYLDYLSMANLTHYLNFEQTYTTVTDLVTSEVLTGTNLESTDIIKY